MKLLTNDADEVILRLIRKCKRTRWAVAWASLGFNLYEALKLHEQKIDQLVVGVHFYQTHPDFIESFLKHPRVRFKMATDGVFHPKVYLFEHGDGEWDCIVGSPNFTKAAYTKNEEVAVHFCQSDIEGARVYAQLNEVLDKFFEQAEQVDADYLDRYRSIWRRQQRHLQHVAGTYSDPDSSQPTRSPLATGLFKMVWDEYYEWVRTDKHHTIDGRLRVLEGSRKLFLSKPHFADLDMPDRRAIGGLIERGGLDWKWFGSMRGALTFKALIRDNDAAISEALDSIPLDGRITHNDFERYIERIRDVLGDNPLATATRLLALKRPDYFVCLDSKNEKSFLQDFGIKKKVHVTEYWDRVIGRIVDSNWWNSPEPQSEVEQRIWRCRVAFLDVPWYDE